VRHIPGYQLQASVQSSRRNLHIDIRQWHPLLLQHATNPAIAIGSGYIKRDYVQGRNDAFAEVPEMTIHLLPATFRIQQIRPGKQFTNDNRTGELVLGLESRTPDIATAISAVFRAYLAF
jgi:hypothetical protein